MANPNEIAAKEQLEAFKSVYLPKAEEHFAVETGRSSMTAVTPTINEKARQAVQEQIANKKLATASKLEGLKHVPALIQDQSIPLEILMKMSENEKSRVHLEKANKQMSGYNPEASLACFFDAAGQLHTLPYLYGKEGNEYRVADPRTGAKFDGKTLNEAMEKYSDSILADGSLTYYVGGKYITKEINISDSISGKTETLMKFLNTSGFVALYAPEGSVTKVYGTFALVTSVSYFAVKGAYQLGESYERGTLGWNSQTLFDVTNVSAAIITGGKSGAVIRVGSTVLFTTSLSQQGYEEISGIVTDSDLTNQEKKKRIIETAAAVGGSIALQVILHKRAQKLSAAAEADAMVRTETAALESMAKRAKISFKLPEPIVKDLKTFATVKQYIASAEERAAKAGLEGDATRKQLLLKDSERRWDLALRSLDSDIRVMKNSIARAEQEGQTSRAAALGKDLATAERIRPELEARWNAAERRAVLYSPLTRPLSLFKSPEEVDSIFSNPETAEKILSTKGASQRLTFLFKTVTAPSAQTTQSNRFLLDRLYEYNLEKISQSEGGWDRWCNKTAEDFISRGGTRKEALDTLATLRANISLAANTVATKVAFSLPEMKQPSLTPGEKTKGGEYLHIFKNATTIFAGLNDVYYSIGKRENVSEDMLDRELKEAFTAADKQVLGR